MKINFIINEENLDSKTDANILSFLFKKIKDKTDIKMVNINNYKCDNASINIFFGCVNTMLLRYAKSNLLIPNQNSFNKEWVKHLHLFDLIIVKTRYMENIFNTYVSIDKIKYIGWRSTDLYSSVDKDYNEYLLYCYDKNTNFQKIIDAWDPLFPNLNIVNGHLLNLKKTQSNIKYLDTLKQSEFEVLFNTCGIHLCLNNIDSFSHTINQCLLSKSIPILINGGPMAEIVNIEDVFQLKGKKKKLNNLLGSKYDYNIEDLKSLIFRIKKISINTLEIMSENGRKHAIKNHSINDILFKELMSPHLDYVRKLPKEYESILEEDELPKVSCITLTHNRKHMFKLAIYNYNTTDYPKDKLEWIIYDTSNDLEKVDELLPNDLDKDKMNIKYIRNTEQITIGESRNNACKLATHDVIVFMDDDDYYFPQHIKTRVNGLRNHKIVGSRYIASLCINKIISYMNAPNLYSAYGKSISPATLCFHKDILEKYSFNDENINECETLFNSIDLGLFKELSWENIIVSLSHKNNTTNRNVPNTKPNGCMYGWNEKLLKFILELDD